MLYDKQIPTQFFDWVIKQLETTIEPIEDMIPGLKDFNKYSKEHQVQRKKFLFKPQNFMDVLMHKDHWYVIMETPEVAQKASKIMKSNFSKFV